MFCLCHRRMTCWPWEETRGRHIDVAALVHRAGKWITDCSVPQGMLTPSRQDAEEEWELTWPLWRTERGKWINGLRFFRDRLLDGRDTVPSYGKRGRSGAQSGGSGLRFAVLSGQTLGWTGHGPVLRQTWPLWRTERGSGLRFAVLSGQTLGWTGHGPVLRQTWPLWRTERGKWITVCGSFGTDSWMDGTRSRPTANVAALAQSGEVDYGCGITPGLWPGQPRANNEARLTLRCEWQVRAEAEIRSP